MCSTPRPGTTLIACEQCEQLVRSPAGHGHAAALPALRQTPLHRRKPDSINRTWALILTAIILYIPANLLPVLTVISFGQGAPSTIVGGVIELMHAGMMPVAVLVFFASILVPVLKLIGLVFLVLSVQLRLDRAPARPNPALPDHRGHRPLVDGRRVHDRHPGRPGGAGQSGDDRRRGPVRSRSAAW